jgi:O-antigen ligase
MNLSSFSPLWIAAIPGVVAVGLWAVSDLPRFVLFAVMGTMIFPHALVQPGGAQVSLSDVLLLVALAAWLVARSAGAAPLPWLSGNYLLLPLLLFVGVNIESLLWSDDTRSTIVFTIQLIEIVLIIPVVFATLPRSVKDIRHGMMLFVVVTCGLTVAYVAFASKDALPGGLGKNTAGTFVGAGMVMAYALALTERRKLIRRLLAAATLVELSGLFATASRGSLIGAFLGILLMSFLLERRRVVAITLVVVAATSFFATRGTSSGADLKVAGAYDTSVVRKYSFDNAIHKISERPFLGTGAGTYTDFIEELELGLLDPNNLFLLTWAEVGIPGVLALLFLLFRYARLLLAVRRLPADATETAVGAGCVALSLLVHFQVDVSWTRGTTTLLYAMFGIMLALERLTSPAVPPPAREANPPPRGAIPRVPAGAA